MTLGRLQDHKVQRHRMCRRSVTASAAGDITWMDLLRRRFSEGKASDPRSVYQVIHDWRSENDIANKLNQFIKRDSDPVSERALGKYRPKTQSPLPGGTKGAA